MVKHFDRCLCTDLRTGTIIIGALGLFGGFYYIIAAFLNVDPKAGQHDQPVSGGSVTRIIMGIIGLAQVILNGVLILGAVKSNAKLVRPWILVTAVLLCLGLIGMVVQGIYEFISGNLGHGMAVLIGGIILALIQVSFILFVNSFHTTLLSGEPVATQSV